MGVISIFLLIIFISVLLIRRLTKRNYTEEDYYRSKAENEFTEERRTCQHNFKVYTRLFVPLKKCDKYGLLMEAEF